MRVWYNGRTSAFQADDAGSIPATRSNIPLQDKNFYELPYQSLVWVANRGDGHERFTRSHSSVGRALPW